MSLHVLHVPTHVTSERSYGEHWCFYCRKWVEFTLRVHVPDDPMSYYGPHVSIKCERGHDDGDLFPGRYREWEDG
jgi:hypothetical protein